MLAAMWSSHSRAMVVLMFVLSITTMTTVPATASSIEHCLRLQMNMLSPSPPSGYHSDLSRIVCRDVFRATRHSLRSTGKLPFGYLSALCTIFHDNQDKVDSHITATFRTYDLHQLIAGRSCATIRNIQQAPPPSSRL